MLNFGHFVLNGIDFLLKIFRTEKSRLSACVSYLIPTREYFLVLTILYFSKYQKMPIKKISNKNACTKTSNHEIVFQQTFGCQIQVSSPINSFTLSKKQHITILASSGFRSAILKNQTDFRLAGNFLTKLSLTYIDMYLRFFYVVISPLSVNLTQRPHLLTLFGERFLQYEKHESPYFTKHS